MNESNTDAPALVRRRRRIARQQREKTPEPQSKITNHIKPKYSDDESSSTTTNEHDKHANPAMIFGTTRIKIKTGSNSSGGEKSGNNSNIAYREKILNRRDRAQRPVVRSQSQPRVIPPDSPPPELKAPSDSSGNVVRFLRRAKRSLSIPRYIKWNINCPNSLNEK